LMAVVSPSYKGFGRGAAWVSVAPYGRAQFLRARQCGPVCLPCRAPAVGRCGLWQAVGSILGLEDGGRARARCVAVPGDGHR
jgi:hypothetical protein